MDILNAILTDMLQLYSLYEYGGVVTVLLLVLSIVTLAIILWKIWRFLRLRVWHHREAELGVQVWLKGNSQGALARLANNSVCNRLVRSAIIAYDNPNQSVENAREATICIANQFLQQARSGLKALDLIVIIAPLLGLLGTVLGMIEAFQALQSAGGQSNPSVLAGGIWKALLTTAVGMGLAIPTAIILTWFESILSRLQHRMEDMATRIFTRPNQ